MTDEERGVLEKLGFRLEDGAVKHLKMGIVERCEVFEGFASLAELEAYAKAMLRTRCRLRKTAAQPGGERQTRDKRR